MTEDRTLNLKNTVEAVIFASGEPIERARLLEAFGCSPERLDAIMHEIKADYDAVGSAVELLLLGSQVQFATRPQYADLIRNVLDMKRNQPLSAAAFEVLAIIAYNQPVTRAFVEQIRGVDPLLSADPSGGPARPEHGRGHQRAAHELSGRISQLVSGV